MIPGYHNKKRWRSTDEGGRGVERERKGGREEKAFIPKGSKVSDSPIRSGGLHKD